MRSCLVNFLKSYSEQQSLFSPLQIFKITKEYGSWETVSLFFSFMFFSSSSFALIDINIIIFTPKKNSRENILHQFLLFSFMYNEHYTNDDDDEV